MFILKTAAHDSSPLGSKPTSVKLDVIDYQAAKQQALNVFKSSRRAWVSLEDESDTCLYLLSVCGAQERSGSKMVWVAWPKFQAYKPAKVETN